MSVFITGTDTNVGKTYVTVRLLRALRARGVDAVGFKPLCCGSRDDAEALHAASDGVLSLNETNPVWLRAPAAPYTAALIESRSIDLALIRETFVRLQARHGTILVEGVGGWLVPVLRDFTMADLAMEWRLPVIIVVANRLGALNHAALTMRAIQEKGLPCVGLIFNNLPPPDAPSDGSDGEVLARTTNPSVFAEWMGGSILGEVATSHDDLSEIASKCNFL